MAKGDIVLITFPFTDLSGSKLRPAVILAETEEDLTVCFPSSQRLQYGTLRDYPNISSKFYFVAKPGVHQVIHVHALGEMNLAKR